MKKQRKIMLRLLTVFVITLITVLGMYILITVSGYLNDGFYPLNKAMELAGYTADSKTSFVCVSSGKEITVDFDFENGVCKKNLYHFEMERNAKTFFGKYFVDKTFLSSVLGGELYYVSGRMEYEEYFYTNHEWCNVSRLVAHAGGAIREEGYESYYTNALEAIVQNYDLGHRVFEIDFFLTSDNNLAAVHDWDKFGHFDGTYLSAAEWKGMKTSGAPVTDSYYTTMLIGDVLDEMLVNKDMFIVTDTKFIDEKSRVQFQLIYDEAVKRDINLLNRIIPQIYNEEMYDIVTSIYKFPSIIYTTYATGNSSDRIIEFASNHENIKVITANISDSRFDEQAINKIHSEQMYLFTHTFDSDAQLAKNVARKVDGFYTNLITPSKLEEYYASLQKN